MVYPPRVALLDWFRRAPVAAPVLARVERDELPVHVQPDTRPERRWTPEGLESALQAADSGDMQRAADICESLMTDPQIRSVLDQRVLGLQGLPLTFSGERNTEAERLWWRMLPPAELARLHRWGIMLGVVAIQWRYPDRPYSDGTYHPAADVWHPRWLRWQPYEHRWQIATRETGLIFLDEFPGEWTLYRPFGNRRPWAEGYWRALAFAWLLKRFALADRARHSEVNGTPIRKGSAPQGATDSQRSRWRSILAAMGRDSAVVLPAGWDLSLVETTGRGAELYDQQIEWADKAFAKVLTGAPILSEGSNMGFGEGTVFAAIKRDLIRFDALTLRNDLANDVDYWIDQNFGEGEHRFAWVTEPPEEQTRQAETVKATAEAAQAANLVLASHGKSVDIVSVLQRLGVPLLDTADEESIQAAKRAALVAPDLNALTQTRSAIEAFHAAHPERRTQALASDTPQPETPADPAAGAAQVATPSE